MSICKNKWHIPLAQNWLHSSWDLVSTLLEFLNFRTKAALTRIYSNGFWTVFTRDLAVHWASSKVTKGEKGRLEKASRQAAPLTSDHFGFFFLREGMLLENLRSDSFVLKTKKLKPTKMKGFGQIYTSNRTMSRLCPPGLQTNVFSTRLEVASDKCKSCYRMRCTSKTRQ